MTAETEILSVNEAGQLLGITGKRVRQLIAAGELPAKLLGRQWALLRKDVERYRIKRDKQK